MKRADARHDVPNIVLQVCKDIHADEIYVNIEYEVDEMERDALLVNNNQGVVVKSFHDQCIVTPGVVKSPEGLPFKTFVPFRKSYV